MRYDGILTDDRCERCSRLMTVRTVSYFTEETICPDCLGRERNLIVNLRRKGVDPASLASCGYLPSDDEVLAVPLQIVG